MSAGQRAYLTLSPVGLVNVTQVCQPADLRRLGSGARDCPSAAGARPGGPSERERASQTPTSSRRAGASGSRPAAWRVCGLGDPRSSSDSIRRLTSAATNVLSASCRQSRPSGDSQTVLRAGCRKHALPDPPVRGRRSDEAASAAWLTRCKTSSLRYGIAPAMPRQRLRCPLANCAPKRHGGRARLRRRPCSKSRRTAGQWRRL